MLPRWLLTVAAAAAVSTAPPARAAADPPSPAETAFATTVLPLLKTKCFACHGGEADKVKGGLDLTDRAKLLAGGDGGPGVVPGKAGDSLFYKAVTRADADVSAMPPKENDKLTAGEMAAVKLWIDGGAPWPAADRVAAIVAAAKPVGVQMKTSGGLSADWTDRRYKPEDLWAYQPLRRPPVPANAANPVDAFVNARLRDIGLSPAPEADPLTLVRRVTFDLTGLPPTPQEIDAFLADCERTGPGPAFERLAERLLASPHRGEQLARHWLDVVRYADSAGFANDYDRGPAWRYRDYVVRAFNADKPYDRFAAEQIAGDEIDPSDPELLVAAGFLRAGAWELTGMEVAKVARQRFLDDVTDAVGQAFLGHMLQCARCHDHKFDPVPTRDYYRVQAAFATTQIADRPAAFLPSENTDGRDERKYLDARRKWYDAELARIKAKEADGRAKWRAANPGKAGEKPPRHEFLSTADLGMERVARKGLERLKWEADRYEPVAVSVYSGRWPGLTTMTAPFRPPADALTRGDLEGSFILAGGDPFSPRDAVAPGVLSAAGETGLPADVSGRRRALAAWVTSANNPLTARVMANRVWQWTMGTPLAGNPNNFGATGKKPTHPELLDWLAAEFAANGWSVKSLQRQIVLSDAYRRSSRHPDPAAVAAKDPTGASYAAFRPRRLAAEELRDAMLAASGELNPALGGIPARPEVHPAVALQPRQVMGTFANAYEPSPRPEQRHRRTLYALKLRGLRDPALEVFGQPSPDLSCEARDVATVSPQAFALFNGEHARGLALVLADRASKATNSRADAVALAFRLTVARPPTPAESAACLAHWEAMAARHRAAPPPAKAARPREHVRDFVEENTGERYTITEPVFSAADFVPDLHPADVTPEVRGLMEVCLVLLNANEFVSLD